MRNFELPEKAKKFLVPGVLVLAVLLIVGGFYFRQRSLMLTSQEIATEQEGEVSGARTALPAGRQAVPKSFPQDIPLFTPSETLSSMESQERIQVTLQTEAPVERVLQFYQQKMKDLGWQLTGSSTFSKNTRRLQLTITSNPAGPTLIILSTTP